MKYLVAAVLVIIAVGASAGKCTPRGERWGGEDKQEHLLLGAGVSWIVGLHTESPMKGFLWGTGVSIGKELLDLSGAGQCSFKDFAAGVVGAGFAAGGAHIFIKYRERDNKLTVIYSVQW